MTTQLTAGYISDAARTNAEEKTAFENLVSILKETYGGSAPAAATLSGNAFTPTNNAYSYVLTGQGSVADDLDSLGTTNLRAGQYIAIACADAAQPITIKHATAGTGHIRTRDGYDYKLNDLKDIVVLRYNTTAPTYFEEVGRLTDPLRLFGQGLPSELTIASGVVVPTRWMHSLAGEGAAADDLSELTPTWLPKGYLVALIGNDGYTITLKHNTGTNKMIMAEAADISLTSSKQTVIFQLNSDGITWREFAKSGFAAAAASTTWTVSAKSANYETTDDTFTLYEVDATTAKTVTLDDAAATGTHHKHIRTAGSAAITFNREGTDVIYTPLGEETSVVVSDASSVEFIKLSGGWAIT